MVTISGRRRIGFQAQPLAAQPFQARAAALLRSDVFRTVAGVVLLAAAYYGAAKLGQTLRYTASVAAIWPPAGLGIAVLYLWGLRWWPGIFLGELIVNGLLLLESDAPPFGSLVGQQAGNMAEIVLGAILLRRLIGPRAALDRVEQVGGMLLALSIATAISATFGTVSMLAGGVIDASEAGKFWRTWWLGDTSGGLVVLPLLLVWAPDPLACWRRLRKWEGALLVGTVATLAVVAVSTDEPVTYMVFPALIWAALRFGPPGATLSTAIAAGAAIGVTANDLGPFSEQPIDHRTLSTQAYIAVAALTTLFLSAVVAQGERSSRELAEAQRHEGERAAAERHRIARELHDAVSQSLFSTVLHVRTAQRALEQPDANGKLAHELTTIGDLTRSAQDEMRSLIFELGNDPVEKGLVAALAEHASLMERQDGLSIVVEGPPTPLTLPRRAEAQLFAIGREALANVVKHAGARTARLVVREPSPGVVLMEVSDDGSGFDSNGAFPGHFGLESMRGRAEDIGALLTIASRPGTGTVVSVEIKTPVERA
jgi:signal transduction histidine kinase